jgi:6-phosphogluconolactonase (cycloisomerase 2 family)
MNDPIHLNRVRDPGLSRRDLLKSSVAALVVTSLTRPVSAWSNVSYVFVGGAYDATASANGISTYTQDPITGALTFVAFTPNPNNPSFLATHRSKNVLYAADEVYPKAGTVSAYQINADGSLTLLNTVNSSNFPAPGPAYVSVHPSGKYLLAASWGGAYISAVQILSDGSLGLLTDTVLHTGNLGPNQTQAHPHMIKADPSGKFIIVQDLGQDRTYVYTLGLSTGIFRPGPVPFMAAQPGAGPRHFAFHPDGTHMYSVNEVGSIINVYLWSSRNGTLRLQNTLSTLPHGYVAAHGVNTAAEIAVSNDGNFVYGSNRSFDSIVTFSTTRYGLDLRGAEPKWTWTRGETPRQFTLSPDGRFLYASNTTTNTITIFKVDIEDGDLYPTNEYVGVASPACILFR